MSTIMHNPRNGGRKPQGDRPKVKIPISLDADLVEWLKSQGAASTVANQILRDARNAQAVKAIATPEEIKAAES